ncbi:efflux RND transporter periplasmic adaptor subunit [Pedobacter sp.]|uniref:efflux RND transporter periplasmic adaptor subunit n=1 Tax=Pedobacter sp. TaxID=1411316 RepID=UPI003D7F4830
MDKAIEAEVITNKKKKKILLLLIIAGIIVCGIFTLRAYIKPSISKSRFITAVADRGNIENTISATGEILPEFEETLTSSINSALKAVLIDAGTPVKAGQSILTLDQAAAQTESDKLGFQIVAKENEIRKLKLDLEKSFYDMKSNNSIKQLKISNFKEAVTSAQRLYNAGGGTRENIEQAELNLKVANLEKAQLENEIKNKQQTMKIEIKEAEIQLSIQKNDQLAFLRKLHLANVIATRNGVVTWVNKNIGTSIKEGEALAKIANLSSYKVEGSISDNQIDRLQYNMPVIIRINELLIRGTVVNVSPAVNNSIVSFEVKLDKKDHKLLRPNLKVDLFLITETRKNVIRVPNGPAFKGSDLQQVFVLNKGVAERREVNTGLSNFDFIEIVSGIKPGEQVITSDLSKFEHSKEIVITD